MRPAAELGIRRVWVNRQAEKDDPAIADAMVSGLADLPDAVRRLSGVAR
jgi:2-haloacid dehalogenase